MGESVSELDTELSLGIQANFAHTITLSCLQKLAKELAQANKRNRSLAVSNGRNPLAPISPHARTITCAGRESGP